MICDSKINLFEYGIVPVMKIHCKFVVQIIEAKMKFKLHENKL